jgi:hypothetical protein
MSGVFDRGPSEPERQTALLREIGKLAETAQHAECLRRDTLTFISDKLTFIAWMMAAQTVTIAAIAWHVFTH